MLEEMLTAVTNVRKQEQAHNVMLMLKLTELVLEELKRYGYDLPMGDPLPDDYGGYNGSYKDTIELWYGGDDLYCEFYYPSRGTGAEVWKGKFIDAGLSLQNRIFRLLYDAWRKLSCEMDHRLKHAAQGVYSEINADKVARRRDAETRRRDQERHRRPVPEPVVAEDEAAEEQDDEAVADEAGDDA